MKRVLKTGSSFKIPMRLIDMQTNAGIVIDSTMTLSAKVAHSNGAVLAVPTVTPYLNQSENAGWCVTDLPAGENTNAWPAGIAYLEVRLTINGLSLASQNYEFEIERGL